MPLRHIYLSSGHAEAIDKMIKLLRRKRPEANVALSFKGDAFASTTAVSRSLGAESTIRYFSWPLLPYDLNAVEKCIQDIRAEKILGIFVNPSKKSPESLEKLSKLAKSKDVPLIFDESQTSFYQESKEDFFISSRVHPDGMLFYAGGQLGVVACKRDLFIPQPLTMISTWDGDEHSLNLLRERILGTLKKFGDR